MTVNAGQASAVRPRVAYLDWLRILAVLLLIPFHSARLFDFAEPFYVKNAETSTVLTLFMGAVVSWHMPLLFVLAGAATWFALGFRSPAQYVGERLKRLVIPLLFGVLVVVPPQMYFAQRFHNQYAGSYLDFYPGFFQLANTADYYGIGFTRAHLWFVEFLFEMSLIALPLFLLLRTKAGARLTGAIAHIFARSGAVLLLALPLPFTALLEDPMGHNFGLFLILFVYGYLLLADARFPEAMQRGRLAAAGLGLLCSLAYLGLVIVTGTDGEAGDAASILFQFAFNFSGWFWIVAIVGFGRQYLDRASALLRYANEAAYPVYILHQTVIVVLGYYVVQWPGPAVLKFAALVLVSSAVTLAIYELLVRRVGVLRFLFGMKQSGRREHAQAVSAEAHA